MCHFPRLIYEEENLRLTPRDLRFINKVIFLCFQVLSSHFTPESSQRWWGGGQGKPRSIRDSEANSPKASVGRGSRVCNSTISRDFPHFSLGGLPSSACWFHILMSQGLTKHSRYKTRGEQCCSVAILGPGLKPSAGEGLARKTPPVQLSSSICSPGIAMTTLLLGCPCEVRQLGWVRPL